MARGVHFPKKRVRRIKYGQHMLVSGTVADRFVDFCKLSRDDRILEIGAGRGFLTRRLAERVAFVGSFEIDEHLFESTKELLSPYGNVKVICADAFEHDFSTEKFDSCVTSLPYSESLRFLRWLAQRSDLPKGASAILQSEFAEKLVSPPGKRSYRAISVIAKICFKMEIGFKIGREAFEPPPRVESRAVRFDPNLDTTGRFFEKKKLQILDYFFSFRGRRLSSALKKIVPAEKVGLLPKETFSARVETIAPEEYQKILGQIEHLIP